VTEVVRVGGSAGLDAAIGPFVSAVPGLPVRYDARHGPTRRIHHAA
jgi:hypothetical protein